MWVRKQDGDAVWQHFATPAAALRYIKSEGAPSNLQQVQIKRAAKNSNARNGFEFSVEAPKAPFKPARTTAYTLSVAYIYYYTPLPLNLASKQATTSNNKHFSFLFWLLLSLIAPGSTLLWSILEPRWCPCQIQVYSQKISGGAPERGRQVGRCPPKSAQLWTKNNHFSPKIAPKPGQNAQTKGNCGYILQAA